MGSSSCVLPWYFPLPTPARVRRTGSTLGDEGGWEYRNVLEGGDHGRGDDVRVQSGPGTVRGVPRPGRDSVHPSHPGVVRTDLDLRSLVRVWWSTCDEVVPDVREIDPVTSDPTRLVWSWRTGRNALLVERRYLK